MHPLVLPFLLLSLTWCWRFGNGRLIRGIYVEPYLDPGYNLVLTVPPGTRALNVTQSRQTGNYLAIKLKNGNYLLNGNYKISRPGKYTAAGTTFVYIRQGPHNLETIAAAGPLQENVHIMLLYREPNPGVDYRFVTEMDEESLLNTDNSVFSKQDQGLQVRRSENAIPARSNVTSSTHLTRSYNRKKFLWKTVDHSSCSKSCGGGIQTIRIICIKQEDHHLDIQVPDRKCQELEKPPDHVSCNTELCPPKWRAEKWSLCSTTCGSGIRTREIRCVQEVSQSLTMIVKSGACMDPVPKNLRTTEICDMPACHKETTSISNEPQWSTTLWSPCSTSCGAGERSRVVTCNHSTLQKFCDITEEPASHEPCNLGPCLTTLTTASTKIQNSQWLFTDWPKHCSAECGVGVQTRRVLCEISSNEQQCDESSRPDMYRDCSSDKVCSGQWFIGPWTGCSSNCDIGEQTREVICITKIHNSLHVALNMYCPVNKPESRRPCRERPCKATWFTSDWTQCSRSCSTGVQRRDVKCLNEDGQLPKSHELHCREEDRPVSRRRCNDYPCKGDLQWSENSNKYTQQIANDLGNNPPCKDKLGYCMLVRQSRLCSFPSYNESCCLTCSMS